MMIDLKQSNKMRTCLGEEEKKEYITQAAGHDLYVYWLIIVRLKTMLFQLQTLQHAQICQ